LAEIFRDSLAEIKRNRQRRLDGFVNTIPFSLTRFNTVIPGVQKENYTLVTASSGVGKSKITKRLYVIDPIDFVLNNPQMGIKLDIHYFCLEESKRRFIQSLKCAWIYKNLKKRIPIKHLISRTELLDEWIVEEIEKSEPYFDKVESMLHIYDDVRNPYGIFERMERFLEVNGTWSKKTIMVPSKERKGELEPKSVRDKFTYNHPDHYVMGVVDHYSLMTAQKNHKNLHEAVTDWSSNFAIQLRDKYYCSIVGVQQQEAAKEKQQYTYKGQSIESKLEPSLDGLGDNKLTQRDANEVLGLFAPDRYEIKDHFGYRVDKLEDNYRSLSVLKSRDGESNVRVGLFFDGAVNHFEELPPAEDMYEDLYVELLARVEKVLTVNFGE
jgi:replicative DNA helicase